PSSNNSRSPQGQTTPISPSSSPSTSSSSSTPQISTNNSNNNNINGNSGHATQSTIVASPSTQPSTSTFVSTSNPISNNNSQCFAILPEAELDFHRPDTIVSYFMTVVVEINGQRVRVLLDSACSRS